MISLSNVIRAPILLIASQILSACNGALPVLDLEFSEPAKFRKYVEAIVRHVGCELGEAVYDEYSPSYPETFYLKNWAAKIALTIRAKNTLSLNGSSSLFGPSSVGVFSIGIGSQSDSTREMVITYFVTFEELIRRQLERQAGQQTGCNKPPNQANDTYSTETIFNRPIAGNLGISTTLMSAMETWTTPGLLSSTVKNGPFETVTHNVTFEVRINGGANPALSFSNVTANVGSKLLDATRTDTNQLQITMGPLVIGDRGPTPSKALDNDFFVERLRNVIRRDN